MKPSTAGRVAAGALLLWGMTGCTSAVPPSAGDFGERRSGMPTPGSFEVQARALGEKMCAAFQNDDCARFVALLPAAMRRDFDEEAFRRARAKLTGALGEAAGFTFLGTLTHPLLAIQLWKVAFVKEASDGAAVTQEALLQISIGRVDDHPQVVSFGFL